MRGNNVNSFFEGAVPKTGHTSSQNDDYDGDFKARVMLSNRHDAPSPFRLLGAAAKYHANARSAVIVSCPHAGRYYPEDLVAAGSIGIDLELRNRIQGHAMTDVGSVHYDRWSYLPQKREAMSIWASELEQRISVLSPTEP